MIKFKYFLLGALPLLAASCSDEATKEPMNPQTGNLRLRVSLEDNFKTRADDSAGPADVLLYAIYDADNNNMFVSQGQSPFTGNSVDLELNLTTSKSYEIALFATSSLAANGDEDAKPVYVFNGATTTLNVNYANMTSGGMANDSYDCFYKTKKISNVGSSSSPTSLDVILQRPVAQINWGTTSLSSLPESFGENGEYLQSKLIMTPYTSMNLLSGTKTLGTSQVVFPASGIVNNGEGYPGGEYTYIACQYVLAPESANFSNVELWVTNAGAGEPKSGALDSYQVKLQNVQVAANFQTNIYGDLLSGEPGTATWDEWDSSTDPFIWDGNTVTYPTVPSTTAEPVVIGQVSDLAGLAEMVNGTNGQTATDFEGYTITLDADFDMNYQTFPMIGSATRSSATATGNAFKGVFDGQGHTISNMKIEGTTSGSDAIGFIGNLDGEGSVLKDLIFKDLTINAPNNEQAAVVGLVTNGASVSGVTVKSGTITAKEAAAGIVGRVLANGSVTGCNNSAEINTGTNGGGIVGAAYYTQEGSSMTIENCNNYGPINGTSQAVAGIVGLSAANVSGCTNEGAITSTGSAAGGIVGQQYYAGSVTGCTNKGNVIGGNSGSIYGAGGIVGWVRYSGSTATNYARQNVITVNKNTNTGNVQGNTGVGGIVGMWYTCGVCDYNTNTAETISGNSFVSGIVGGQQWTETPPTLAPEGSDIEMLYVEYNYTNTKNSDGEYLGFVYINSQGKVTESGNSNTEPGVVDGNSSDTETE